MEWFDRLRGAVGVRWRWWRSAPARSIPSRWVRSFELSRGEQVCLFVTVARAGRVLAHARHHAAAWHAAGFAVVLVVAVDRVDEDLNLDGVGFARGVILRENAGYDFGAWAAVIEQFPGLRSAGRLVLANDSLYGPTDDFGAVVDRIRSSPADVIGLTSNSRPRDHLQSFVLVFSARALGSAAFSSFWRGMRTGTRTMVIHHGEFRLTSSMTAAGLRCEALFTRLGDGRSNTTLDDWRSLLAAGFPFVKIQLLRDNPLGVPIAGWQEEVARRGFDPAIAEEHLGLH